MPAWEAKSRVATDKRDAVLAEVLYLVNLLLLPGIAFLALLWLYWSRRAAPDWVREHIRQTVVASVAAGVLLIGGTLLIIGIGGQETGTTWAVVVVYFVVCHASLVLLGALGLSRAMAGQAYRYPVLGRIAARF